MASSQNSVPTSASGSSRARGDPGWKYVHSVEENNTNNTICNFCSKIMKGGITRAKQHLSHLGNNVAKCSKVPSEVRKEIYDYMKQKQRPYNGAAAPNVREFDLGFGLSEEDLEDIPNPSVGVRIRGNTLKGPLDLFVRNPNDAIRKKEKEKMRQQNIREACDKKAVERVHQFIARWWYQGRNSI